MSSIAPVDGDGIEGTAPLDDLLPPTAPEARRPEADAPAPGRDLERQPPSRAEIEEIEALHEEVVRASAACESSMFGGKTRRHLRAVLKSEDEALRRLGCTSYADFALVARTAGWGAQSDAADAATGPAANGHAEPAVADDAVPGPDDAPRPTSWRDELTQLEPRETTADDFLRRELDETRLALRLTQEELERTRADLADATAVHDAMGSAADSTLVELEQERARAELATAEVARTRQELDEARAELERHRQALAEAGTTAGATDGAHRQRVEELEERVVREQGARVTAEAEAALATEQLAEVRTELEQLRQRAGASTNLEAELAAAQELAAQARAEAESAIRSRDAAIDEVATERAQLAELGDELTAARAELARVREEQEQAVLAATEAAGAREAQRTEELERAVAEVAELQRAAAAAEEQHAAELAEVGTALDAARDALESARAETTELSQSLETVRAEGADFARALEDTRAESADLTRALEEARAEGAELSRALDAAQTEIGELNEALAEARAQVAERSDALAEARAQVAELSEALAEAQQESEPDPSTPAGVDELARVAELAHARTEAEQQLTEVQDRVEQLQDKRRRLKRRIEQQRARYAAERAALDRELAWNREQVDARLATLEHHVEAVTTDAETLRAQLAAVRATLPPGDEQDAPDGRGARP